MNALKKASRNELIKRMILNTLKLEEGLSRILKEEAKLIRKKSTISLEYREIRVINRTIKYIVFLIMILDKRLEEGFNMLNESVEREFSKK